LRTRQRRPDLLDQMHRNGETSGAAGAGKDRNISK